MKKLCVVACCVVLAGCSTPKIEGFTNPESMNRQEVIQASKECVNARMKPIVNYLPQKTDFGKLLVPVSVYCEPYR
jgi:uncharacterized lipoprotein YajG